MRILLLDPEDSPRRGPWSRQRWDLVIDLGRSSGFSEKAWTAICGCPVLRADSYRGGVVDVRHVRGTFSAGRGRLVDEAGIDWWELTSLLLVPEAMEVLALRRLGGEISKSAEVWATRRGMAASLLAILLRRDVNIFAAKGLARHAARAMHYAGVVHRFSAGQIQEIVLDKYDPAFRWRARWSRRRQSCVENVVLLPSAYGNVSRMAAAYARMLPQQNFLMVATRESAKEFMPPENVVLRDLADYAKPDRPTAEIASLLDQWPKFEADLSAVAELYVLSRAGVLAAIPDWIRDGLSVRDAWQEVIEREPVCGVLCGDDSNRYTRLPVLLAAKRKIPTVDFHHGALDGRYVLKDLPCDVYLAKNEMERDYLLRVCGLTEDQVVIGAPASQNENLIHGSQHPEGTSVILFSEPYDVLGMRSEEVYRELLPPLCHLARDNGRDVIIKLHPFESRSQRQRLVREILAAEDSNLVSIVDGPLTEPLMAKAWVGITVESTTVLDCLQHGIPCFLCGWLTLSPYEYREQYARFGIGEVLQSVEQVSDIPRRVEEFGKRAPKQGTLWKTADPQALQQWLTCGRQERLGARGVR